MPVPISAAIHAELMATYGVSGCLPRRATPLAYRLATVAVAAVMVLLPAIYLVLIASVSCAVYYYARHGLAFVQDAGMWGFVLVYFGPLFAGATLVVFMIKPLFARFRPGPAPVEINLADHPELATLLRAVSIAVDAPMPVRIELDCQANAAARLRRGILSIGRRDLVLQIGLPLVGALSTREFAGVLAHELAHFRQSAGMGFFHAIQAVNRWFARVVFGRDAMDAKLVRASERGGMWWIQAIAGMARLAVIIARLILKGLMQFGHMVSCVHSRQMEFDADYYESALVGSETFVQTSREVALIGTATKAAMADLQRVWKTRQTIDDLPELALHHRRLLTAEAIAEIEQALNALPTAWANTHPSYSERNDHAMRLQFAGVFTGEGAAADLLRNFPALAREATRNLYAQLGIKAVEANSVPVAKIEQAVAEEAAANQARARLFGTVLNVTRPPRWRPEDFAATTTGLASWRDALAAARLEIERLRAEAVGFDRLHGSIYNHLQTVEVAALLLRTETKIYPRPFHLEKADLREAEAEAMALRQRLDATRRDLASFDEAVRRWMALVGSGARTAGIGELLPAAARAELITMTDTVAALYPWSGKFADWFDLQQKVVRVAAQEQNHRHDPGYARAWRNLQDQAIATVDNLPRIADTALNPFAQRPETTIAATLAEALTNARNEGRLTMLAKTGFDIYLRALSRIALRGEQLERAAVSGPTEVRKES